MRQEREEDTFLPQPMNHTTQQHKRTQRQHNNYY